MGDDKIDERRFDELTKVEFDLPLVKITKEDVLGAMFVHMPNNESYGDSICKLQVWIHNFAEEQIAPLKDSGQFTEKELETIKQKIRVISPITLTLYLHWYQMEQFAKMSNSAKERWLLEKIPDRFKARFKGNEACRNAREITAEEEAARNTSQVESDADSDNVGRGKSFVEFLQEFGAAVKKELESHKPKTNS